MAVYYKFKSAKDYETIPIDGFSISVFRLKEKIFQSKKFGRGIDYDLAVIHAQTNEEYADEEMLIPKGTSVLIRRLPGPPRMPIVTEPVINQDKPKVDNESQNAQPSKSTSIGADPAVQNYPDLENDEFGDDLYGTPDIAQASSSTHVGDALPPSKAEEDSKIRALIDTPSLDWQRQLADVSSPGRGFGRGMSGRMGARSFGQGGGLEQKTPPQGYVCHRCNIPGHFIQHCPTNGDPTFDFKRMKPPTGIPKFMLTETPDGSYSLLGGARAVLKPNEADFEKEIEGMPSTCRVVEVPPELHCPLCKQVMKDAVLTSKCCFKSFCDKCIRDHIISKSICVCQASNVLADDLLPNKTLRDTINRILGTNKDSAENSGSAKRSFMPSDMESAPCPPPKIPSPSHSAASKRESALGQYEEPKKVEETVDHGTTPNAQQFVEEKGVVSKVPNVSEATHMSRSMNESAVPKGSVLPNEEVQQKPAPAEAAKKKKNTKTLLSMDKSEAELQRRASHDFAAENYVMPMGGMQQSFNMYWNGGIHPFSGPFSGGGAMPFMGYSLGPMDIPFDGMPSPDPFYGPGGYMMPPAFLPQRDLTKYTKGMNGHMKYDGPPTMSREKFEAQKAQLRGKPEIECRGMNGGGARELIEDVKFGRKEKELKSSSDITSKKEYPVKQKSNSPASKVDDHDYHRHSSKRSSSDRRSRDPELSRSSSKRNSIDRHHEDNENEDSHKIQRHQHHSHRRSEKSAMSRPPSSEPLKSAIISSTATDRKSKASIFSRISFPKEEEEASTSKKRKVTSETAGEGEGSCHRRVNKAKALWNGYDEVGDHHKSSSSSAVTKNNKSSTAAYVADLNVDYESSDEEDRHFKRRPAKKRG